MGEFIKSIGLSYPFYVAAAGFFLFNWLDRNASTAANTAIGNWLNNRSYTEDEFNAAILAAFDRIYTRPLDTRAALKRSCLISTISFVLCTKYYLYRGISSGVMFQTKESFAILLFPLFVTMTSDYLSLFIVRRWLSYSGPNPTAMFGIAIALGFTTIMVSFIVFLALIMITTGHGNLLGNNFFSDAAEYLKLLFEANVLLAATIIHLWLVFFLIGSVGYRSIILFFEATNLTQWYLKGGDNHPFRAIGIVAAGIAFIFGSTLQAII